MHFTRIATCVGIAILVFVQGVFSQTNPRVGTWKLNLAKSKFDPGPAPKSETQTCEAVDQGISVTVTIFDSSGNNHSLGYTASYDGKDYPFPGSPWDTIALSRIDTYTSEAVFKKAGKVIQRTRIVVSRDRKVLTLTAKGTDTSGQLLNNLEVFDRQ